MVGGSSHTHSWTSVKSLAVLCYRSDLLGKLVLAELVESVEFPRERNVLQEPTAGQLHTDDDLAIGHHHGNRSEVHL